MIAILWLVLNVIALAWIGFRIVYMHQFLLWDWHDGKFQFWWTDDKFMHNPRRF